MKKTVLNTLLAAFLCLLVVSRDADADGYFDFAMPWDDNSQNITNLNFLNRTPAGQDGFVRIKDGHLYSGGARLRLLGVNIVFNGTTPTHEEADKIAARLARFGINAVRFHHMDTQPSPRGLLQSDMETFDPQQLDRFDYFFSALKKNGIYSDINLQVGHRYPERVRADKSTRSGKGIDQFQPELIEYQKKYARELLLHRNPYTGNRYVDEPAVALVEINNESGLLQWWLAGRMDAIAPPYKASLESLWNSWQAKRYASPQAKAQAWSVQWSASGSNLLAPNGRDKDWTLQLANAADASIEHSSDGVTLTNVKKPGPRDWDIQMHHGGVAVSAGATYKLNMQVAASVETKLTVSIMQDHAPWKILWRQSFQVGGSPQLISADVPIQTSESQARLTLSNLGPAQQAVRISSVSFAKALLTKGVSVTANVGVPSRPAFDALPPAVKNDWLLFLWDTEQAYWDTMRKHLRENLQLKSPLIGAQANCCSPAAIQSTLDVIDAHAYWDHPLYPHVQYDVNDWIMQHQPLAGGSDPGSLAELAMVRVARKPFVATEYDHPFPSAYAAEGLPLLASYAGLQDWDGIFQFAYGLDMGNWQSESVDYFFDSHANPVKMAGFISSALLFRRGDIKPSPAASALTAPDSSKATAAFWIPHILASSKMPSADQVGVARNRMLREAVSMSSLPSPDISRPIVSDTQQLVWGRTQGGSFTIDTPLSKGLIGAPGDRVDLGDVSLQIDSAGSGRAVVLAQIVDGQDFKKNARILVTTMGAVQNQAQKGSAAHRSSRDGWGQSPTQLEIVGARVELPSKAAQVKVWALDTRGNRVEAVPVSGGERATVTLGKSANSMWYEIQLGSP